MSGIDGFIVLASRVAVGFGLPELMAFFLTAPKERNTKTHRHVEGERVGRWRGEVEERERERKRERRGRGEGGERERRGEEGRRERRGRGEEMGGERKGRGER